MKIEVRGIAGQLSFRAHVVDAVTEALGRLHVEPVTVQATFADDNGPKGGVAARCAIAVHLPNRAPLRVQHVATTARQALDGCLETLRTALVDLVERARDSRRHPKKYYTAKRLLGVLPAARPARRTARRRAGA